MVRFFNALIVYPLRYLVNIGIGTPPQNTRLQVDSRGDNTWIISSNVTASRTGICWVGICGIGVCPIKSTHR